MVKHFFRTRENLQQRKRKKKEAGRLEKKKWHHTERVRDKHVEQCFSTWVPQNPEVPPILNWVP